MDPSALRFPSPYISPSSPPSTSIPSAFSRFAAASSSIAHLSTIIPSPVSSSSSVLSPDSSSLLFLAVLFLRLYPTVWVVPYISYSMPAHSWRFLHGVFYWYPPALMERLSRDRRSISPIPMGGSPSLYLALLYGKTLVRNRRPMGGDIEPSSQTAW